MQIDRVDVVEVQSGKEVAVKTALRKEQARKGTEVYVVKQ
jgi:hypothetical protein